MVMNNEAHQKVTVTHLSRLAYLYVRQSTLRQVLENTERAGCRLGLAARPDHRDRQRSRSVRRQRRRP